MAIETLSNGVAISHTADTTETLTTALSNIAGDGIVAVNQVDYSVTYDIAGLAGGGNGDNITFGIRVLSGGTVLASGAGDAVVNDTTRSANGQYTLSGTFAYILTTATKAQWDAAVIETTQTYGQVKGPDGGNTSVSIGNADITVDYEAPAATVALNTASETDTGIAMVADNPRSYLVGGPATEINAAFTIESRQGTYIDTFPGLETDSAGTFTYSRQTQIGTAGETNAARALTNFRTVPISTSGEVNLAGSWGGFKGALVGTGFEIDTANAIVNIDKGFVNTASSTESAGTFSLFIETSHPIELIQNPFYPLNTAAETDTAGDTTPYKVVALGTALETDSAAGFTLYKTFTINPSLETDAAGVWTWAVGASVGTALETDTARPIGDINPRTYTLGTASETDSGGAVTVVVQQLVVRCRLVDRRGRALPDLNSISWAWFDEPDPALITTPVHQGDALTTDDEGWFEFPIPNSTLNHDQPGLLILRSDDGVLLGAYNKRTEYLF